MPINGSSEGVCCVDSMVDWRVGGGVAAHFDSGGRTGGSADHRAVRQGSGRAVRRRPGKRATAGAMAFWLQGGYKVSACRLWGWQCQGIAELSVAHFDYFDASFKQFALGVRFGKLMWPKVRTFGSVPGGVPERRLRGQQQRGRDHARRRLQLRPDPQVRRPDARRLPDRDVRRRDLQSGPHRYRRGPPVRPVLRLSARSRRKWHTAIGRYFRSKRQHEGGWLYEADSY